MSRRWRVDRAVGRQGLEDLKPHWDALVEEMPERAWHHSFASHRAYFEHLSSPDRFVGLALVDERGEVRAICPFEERHRRILGLRTRVWELPWDVHNLIRDVICPPGEERRILLREVLKHLGQTRNAPRWLLFARVAEHSVARECLGALGPSSSCADRHGAVDIVDTSLSVEEHSERLSSKFRSNLRNAHRKLEALSDARFVNATAGEELRREFAAFLALEASGWKGEEGTGTAVQLDSKLTAFYEDLLADLPGMEVNALYADGACLASQLCARLGGDYALLKVCYNEDYSKLRPGHLIFEYAVERCLREQDTDRFNLVSHWGWHQDWKPDVVPAYTVYLPTGRWTGAPLLRLLEARFRYGPRIKKWLGRLRSAPTRDE